MIASPLRGRVRACAQGDTGAGPSMIGTTFSHFRITARLGAGGMGTVWLAEDTRLDRLVALKLLALHLATSGAARERFEREARNASRLEHTGIATVYEFGEAEGQVFIAYQFIEGETLAHRLEAGPHPLPDLLRLARGSSEALAHAHGRGVFHRDLTAGNVMLRPDGSPVIVDFGLARTSGDVGLTSTGTTVGTLPYLAPEQWRNEGFDARSDLWSLGVVFYLAATGQMPFGSDTGQAVMYRVMNEEPVKPMKLRADLPPEFERLVLRLLEKDPRDRLQSAEELAGGLQAIAGDQVEPAPVRGESPWARLGRWWRKVTKRKLGPLQVAAVVLAALALGIGAAVLSQRIGQRREHVLAVMPLRNLSGDDEDVGYIGEAFGGELTARLGQLGGFRVLPWETTSRFGDSKEPLARLAKHLGADYLLVGHYESVEDRIRLRLELVDGRTGLQRWSESFERPNRDLGTLQAEIALRLAAQLAPKSSREKPPTSPASSPHDPVAYETFLRGANAMHALDPADQALAEPMFRRALELDSTLSQAWVGLGAVLTDRYFGGSEGGLRTLLEGRDCFQRALALDPGSGAALRGIVRVYSETGPTETALAIVNSAGPGVRDETERELLRGWAGTLCGLPEEGAAACARVLELDPHNQGAMFFDAVALGFAGQFAASAEMCKAYIREFGEDPLIYEFWGTGFVALGRDDEAKTLFARAIKSSQGSGGVVGAGALAGLLQRSGHRAESHALLARSIPTLEANLSLYPDNLRRRCDLATLYAIDGDTSRFDSAWTQILHELALEPNGSGGQYAYAPSALAQSGELGRAVKVISTFPNPDPGFWIVCRPNAPPPANSRVDATARLLAHPVYIAMRAKVVSEQARLRIQYPWVTGRTRS